MELSRTVRIAYKALAWALLGLAALLLVLAVMDQSLDGLSWATNLRLILLGAALLMVLLRWAGNFPKQSLAAWAPFVFLGITASEYVLSASGCSFAGGLHPVNAVGIVGVSLGLVRSSTDWGEEESR